MTGAVRPDPAAASPELAVATDARRLHPLSPVLGVVPALRPFVVPVLLTALGGGRLFLVVVLVIAGGAVVVGGVRQRCTRYVLRDDQLVVWSGVLNRRVRVVSPMRVQKVEVVRLLRHRVADVAAVQVELVGAGRDDTRVELDALGLAEAQRVGDALERGRRIASTRGVESGVEDPSAPPALTLLRLGPGLLALGGVTGAPLLLVPVAVVSLLSEVGGRVEDGVGSWLADLRLATTVVAGLVVAAVGVWAVVAAGIMAVRFHGYELARAGADVVVRRGLLDTRTSVIPLRRVHLVHVSSSVVRRLLGLASVDVRTASQAPGSGPSSLGVTVPVAAAQDVDRLVPILLGRAVVTDADRPHPPAARRRAIVRRAVPLMTVGAIGGAAALAGAGAAVPIRAVGAASGLVGGMLLASAWGAAWYLRLAHGTADGLLVATDGVLVAHRRLVPLDRVQSVVVTQTPLQRRVGLVDLVAHLAGPTPDLRLRDLSPGQAAGLVRLVPGLGGASMPAEGLGPGAGGGAPNPGCVAAVQGAAGVRSPRGGGRESNPPDGDHPSHPL